MSLSEPLPPAAAPAPPAHPAASGPTVAVDRWPSEIPLLCLVAVAALWIWIALAVSIFGIVYAFLIGVFFFFSHVAFVTYVRGSAVKLSERQFPELHARVVELSRRAGLAAPPDAYLMQAGGSLNAFATKLFRSRMIVLFTDLLDECGADEKARDMVIGHEIGHIKSGHLDFHGLLLPGFFVPFLGAAIGAGMGGLTGSLADVGIDDDFIRQVREKVTPGTSALFALTSGATAPDKVIDELKQYDFEIISTNLPEEQERKLREAFAQE
jgi:Zn-dependent protease with chaperone function